MSRAACSEFSVAGLDEAVEPVEKEPGGNEAEKHRAVGLSGEFLECAVESNRFAGVVLERSLHEEDTDESEDEPRAAYPAVPREVAVRLSFSLMRASSRSSRNPCVAAVYP